MSAVGASLIERGVPAIVRGAIEEQALALARGVDAAVRPADVAALAAHPPLPWRGVLSVDDARLATALVHEAISGLEPRIQVNMSARRATDILRDGGRIGNVYDLVRESPRPWGEAGIHMQHGLPTRVANEREMGVFGTGTTVYGALTFSDVMHRPMRSHAGIVRLAERELNTGALTYGEASVVLGQRALDNASFLPADTGVLGGVRPVRAREQLADVVTERLIENFGLGSEPAGRGATSATFLDADVRPSELANDFRSILRMPRERAVTALREHLTSRAMVDGYIEAQVRIATADDIRAVHVRPRPANQLSTAQAATQRADGAELATVGAARGVPVRFLQRPGAGQAG
ncbi:MAG: hypothetical protein JWM98_2775 [Thermoleophilia bacterium]|nr:hypothetical protein [Thermoleophilia bacterium]